LWTDNRLISVVDNFQLTFFRQAHPDKALAKELHEKQPKIYKDPNHKPEMAVALTPFEALSGFRSIAEIKNFLEFVPELKTIIGTEGEC
jgi:mannose-6-phosphate isomerase